MERKLLRILFICSGNTCRSVIAEHLTNTRYPDIATAQSAGLAPSEILNDLMGDRDGAMRELGIDTSTHSPKAVRDISGTFDLAINMSLTDADVIRFQNPGIRAGQWVSWDIPDPVCGNLNTYRLTRDLIHGHIVSLFSSRIA